MNKLIILLFILLFISSVNAAVISERTLKDKGVEELVISGANKEECLDVSFLIQDDFLPRENYVVFSLRAQFSPVQRGEARIRVELNDENELVELKPADFLEGWCRIILPKELLAEENLLKVCGKTSDSITGISLFNDSKLGAYRMADFYHEDSFTKTVSSDVPEINKPFTVYITVRNYGSEPAEVKVNYWVVEMEKVELVGGQTEFQGVIPAFDYDANRPGEEAFSYRVFPEHALQMSLPAATLEYTNIFGDNVFLRSTRPMIFVAEPEFKVDGLLSFKETLFPANALVPGKIIVKNVSQDAVQNIMVYLVAEEGLNLSKEQELITELKPKETREISFTASSPSPGKFEIGCNIVYTEKEVMQFSCAKDYLFFEEEKFNSIVVFGSILTGIAVLIYLFIYYKE